MTLHQDPTSADPANIRLPDRLGLAQARALADQLLAKRGANLTVDASDVQHLGAQCAQVLVAARATWRSDARSFSIVGESAAFAEGTRLLGLADLLQG